MEKTLNAYKIQQSKTFELLEHLSAFLKQGEEAGLEIDPSLKKKLQTAIDNIANDKLKVVLIGGFSEGKTAIAAAWMERLDKSSMKISHQESSDEVVVYDVGTDVVLIDTPGLFGSKEKTNEQTLKSEKYKAITERYVSEAHLILYVMDSLNPVKDTHKEELYWLFRTLNLLSRTVFVLSRFDEVADVEEEQDYQAKLKIKQENVRGRLRDFVQLTDKEASVLSIVAVAANPFDQSTEYWLENLAQFKALSRIAALQEATFKKIQASGGHEALVAETRKSIISDVLNRQMPVAIANDEVITKEISKLSNTVAGLNMQMLSTGRQINEARTGLRDFIVQYFTDLIMQAKGTSLETFNEFYERSIGSEGIVISSKLQSTFDKHLQSARFEMEKMETSFNLEIDHFKSTISVMGKQGVSFLKNSGWINNSTVLATRDGIVSAGKMIGVDLGKWLKFKPYGATKLANGLGAALAVAGIALEVWDSYSEYQRDADFAKAVAKLVENFEQQRKDLVEFINSHEFEEKFFGNFIELRKSLHLVQESLDQGMERQRKFQEWRQKAEAIDMEFRELENHG